AARAGVTLDRRGTQRLAKFTIDGALGRRIQLSGGVEVLRSRDQLVVRRAPSTPSSACITRLQSDPIVFGGWRFRCVKGGRGTGAGSSVVSDSGVQTPWTAALPSDPRLEVRAWRSGDRMRLAGPVPARRVKRFVADARVAGPGRTGWPVVLAAGEL